MLKKGGERLAEVKGLASGCGLGGEVPEEVVESVEVVLYWDSCTGSGLGVKKIGLGRVGRLLG